MEQDYSINSNLESSVIRSQVRISEAWINHFLDEKNIKVPLSKKHHLTSLYFEFYPDQLRLQGDIVEKPGSVIELQCTPEWDATAQVIKLSELQIRIRSKNILVKSAGWFTRTFLQSRLDKKVEQAINMQYRKWLTEILGKSMTLPAIMGGQVDVELMKWNVRSITLAEKHMDVTLEIEGQLFVSMI